MSFNFAPLLLMCVANEWRSTCGLLFSAVLHKPIYSFAILYTKFGYNCFPSAVKKTNVDEGIFLSCSDCNLRKISREFTRSFPIGIMRCLFPLPVTFTWFEEKLI